MRQYLFALAFPLTESEFEGWGHTWYFGLYISSLRLGLDHHKLFHNSFSLKSQNPGFQE